MKVRTKLTVFLVLCVFVWGGEFWWASTSQAQASAALASNISSENEQALEALRTLDSRKDVANVVATCMVIAGGCLISAAKPGRTARIGGIL